MNGNKMLLPLYCKSKNSGVKISHHELHLLSNEAGKFVNAWNEASTLKNNFDSLNDLNSA